MNTIKEKIFFTTLLLIAGILLPAVSFASADKIFKENNKAVVVVVTYNAKGEPISQGSGFIVRPDGAVITNYHVISNAVDIAVKAGGKVLKVEGLLHVDKENDLVILKAKGKDLPFVKIGDIGKMNIGEKVYVISSPQGLENTISDGILSGVREITPKKKILQITAPISPGSSGGPVFNKNGEVIGIATFIIKEAQNLNFAVHVNLIKNKIGSKKVIALDVAIEVYGKSEEEYNKEIEDYSKAIASNPNNAFAYTMRGLAYADKKQYDRAIEDYNKAIAINPNYADAYYRRGGSYYFKEQYDRAISDYDKAIALDPSRFSHHYVIALTYNRRGSNYYDEKQYDKAIEDYDKAIEIYPNYVEAYEDRGSCYWWGKGQYDRAISDYDKAIALHENSPEALKSDTEAYRRRASAYHGRAIIHYEKGQYDKAIDDYSKVISLNPYAAYKTISALIYSERGLAYAGKKEYDKAIANYNKAIALHNDVSYYIYRGLAYAGKKQYNKAIEDYSKEIAYCPNCFALTYFYRGLAYAENKQYDKAIKDYNKIIALSSNFVLAYFYRGNTYYDKGRYDKAIEDYSKVIALNPNDTEAFFYHKDGYDNRIEDFNRNVKDDIRTIIEDYSKIITLNPNNASIYIKRGLAYSLSGNRGKAISDFQKACDIGDKIGCKVLQDLHR